MKDKKGDMRISLIEEQIEPQLWCGRSRLDLSNIDKIENFGAKPEGGFWTSTFTPDSEWCSEWIRWCATEIPERLGKYCYVLYPSPKAKVYTIDSYYYLERLARKCGTVVESGKVFLDWENISKCLDGVHLTESGFLDTKWTRPLNMYHWDVESTLWFRNVFDRIVPLYKIPHKCHVKPSRVIR